jgi:hypothetical protein
MMKYIGMDVQKKKKKLVIKLNELAGNPTK